MECVEQKKAEHGENAINFIISFVASAVSYLFVSMFIDVRQVMRILSVSIRSFVFAEMSGRERKTENAVESSLRNRNG